MAHDRVAKRKFSEFRNRLRGACLLERVQIERDGVPADVAEGLIAQTALSTSVFRSITRIPKATYTKVLQQQQPFQGAVGHSIVGFIDLINLVEEMVRRDPTWDAKEFDAARWIASWIQHPVSALCGMRPYELMDTPTGREMVMRVLRAAQEGVYL